MGVEHIPAALSSYLAVVAEALARRTIGVLAVRVAPASAPQALVAILDLDPVDARPGLGWGPTAAVWHEDLGWWVELCRGHDAGSARRYLPVDTDRRVAAYPNVVADFIAALARGEDLGSRQPPLPRPRPSAPGPGSGRVRWAARAR